MSRKRRSAFTVVEMLVVITIIALLAGFLLPAVQMAREAGRRAQCITQIKQCSQAAINYSTQHQYLPPSRSWAPKALGPNASFPNIAINEAWAYSWVQPLLPHLDNAGATAEIGNLPTPDAQAQFGLRLQFLLCPSDTHEEEGPAAFDYAMNSGRINQTDPNGNTNHDNKANGGSYDALRSLAHTQDFRRNRMTSSDLVDGATNTIAFAENVYLRTWCVTPSSGVNAMTEWHSGVIWEDLPSGTTFPPLDETVIQAGGVNGGAVYGFPISRHPGGFNMAMWDGSARYFSNTMDYWVYGRLMSSDGRRVQDPASGTPGPAWQAQSLSDTDF
jgi:prepilin-type processing-associated H-X9-DG protein/prepilin-type N-terminal cleavage/methylation domain-containing protein